MDLKFDQISKNDQGEYTVKISTQDDGPVFHQLNNVSLTTDLGSGEAVIKGDLSSLEQYNSAVLEYANGHSEEWFGRKVAEATLAKAYQGQDDDSLTADLRRDSEGAVVTRYYSQEKELRETSDLAQEDLYSHVVVELYGLWFVKKNFGPVWRLVQVKDAPPPPRKCPYDDYLFQDE